MIAEDLLREELAALAPYAIPHPPNIRAKLDANESPAPLPPAIAAELGVHLAAVALHRYPDGGAAGLRALIAREHDVAPAQIVFGNGSDELITLLMATFARPRAGATRAGVAYPTPTFIVYRIAALSHGLEPVEIPLRDDFTLDEDRVHHALSHRRPNLIFFALPNNPTGTLWPRDSIAAVVGRYPDMLVIADEAYSAYSGATLLDLLPRHPNLVIMRTLSKIGLAGARVGYLVAHPSVSAAIEKIRAPYNVGSLNQAAAELILGKHRELIDAAARAVVAERERLVAALAAVPALRVFPTRANFLLMRAPDASGLWRRLADGGVLVRSFDRPGPLAGCLRVTVGTREENDLFLAAISDACGSR